MRGETCNTYHDSDLTICDITRSIVQMLTENRKNSVKITDDCATLMSNFIGVRQKMTEINVLICQTFGISSSC